MWGWIDSTFCQKWTTREEELIGEISSTCLNIFFCFFFTKNTKFHAELLLSNFMSALSFQTCFEEQEHLGEPWAYVPFNVNRMEVSIDGWNRGTNFSGNSSSSRESQFNLSQHILQTESVGEASHKVSETSVQSVLCSSGQISGHTALKTETLTSLSHLI